ncbi:MAG: MgtC/SapB family protein [Herminiimonas sp.]|nr:MgtC/SapB family protein [Herminiimonas sp.]
MTTSPERWPYLEMLARFALALALGLLIGMERERRKKEAGLRTFGFIALLGAVGAALGDPYAYIILALTGLLTAFLNIQELRARDGAELTTSAAMLVTCMVGILCGKGHTLTPAAIMVSATALLAWKDRLQGFSIGLTENELRSALLLAILGIVIYPVLPSGTIGPWGLIEPRAAWATVILIAGIGFVNYVLWKLYGTRGVAIAGFLGGLVNSSVTVSELAARIGRSRSQAEIAAAYQGILLATSAMLARNVVILFLLAPRAALSSVLAFSLMLLASAGWALLGGSLGRDHMLPASQEGDSSLTLPFSLRAALKFGLIFLVLHIVGIITQQYFGNPGFYLVSIVGGAVSSASAVAAAASLSSTGAISSGTAATAAVIASIASVVINLPFVLRAGNRGVSMRLSIAMLCIALLGLAGMLLEGLLMNAVTRYLPELLTHVGTPILVR